jgi:hypothetical protein
MGKHVTTLAELMKRTVSLAAGPKERFLELGWCLQALQERSPDDFKKAFARSGLGRRKAYYLVNVSRQVERAKLPKARLRKLGWTKLEVIAKYLSRTNGLKLVKLAEKNTARDLKLLMRGGKPQPNARCVLMYFSSEQYHQFEEAVLRHGGRRGGRGLINKEGALIRAIRRSRHPK